MPSEFRCAATSSRTIARACLCSSLGAYTPRTSLIPACRIRALYRRCRSAVSSAEGFRPVGEAVDRARELRFFAGCFRVTVSLDDVA